MTQAKVFRRNGRIGSGSRGFSLIEVVVAVVIAAALALATIPQIVGASRKVKTQACHVKKAKIELEIRRFTREHGRSPRDLNELVTSGRIEAKDTHCPVGNTTYTLEAGGAAIVGHVH